MIDSQRNYMVVLLKGKVETPLAWAASVGCYVDFVIDVISSRDLTGLLSIPAVGDNTRAQRSPKTRVDHKNSEEAALVRRVQAGDELAFREIVERFQTKIFSVIYGILRNHNDAEDMRNRYLRKYIFRSATSIFVARC